MKKIEKISDITSLEVAEYLRLPEITEGELNYIDTLINVAIDYILKFTGIESRQKLDDFTDLIIAVFILCQDMYDVRSLYVDTSSPNKTIEVILGLHQRNLL